MITITGTGNTPEDRAAQALRDSILDVWPDAESSEYQIRIIPSAKLWTESTKDLDILVLVYLPKPIELAPQVDGRPVFLRSLCLVVEVKDNSAFEFRGNKLWVRYGRLWESTSEQAEKQKFALLDYVRRETGTKPYVYSTVWLRPANAEEIPDAAVSVLSSSASWNDFLLAVIRLNETWLSRQPYPLVDSNLTPSLLEKLDTLFTRKLVASELNRQKIEEICKGKLHGQKYDEKMGQQMLLFTGRGGTGKTISLLRTAWDLYEKRDRRVLILTYNHALRADIERLLLLLGMKNGAAGRNIHIKTADKYLKDLIEALGVEVRWIGNEFESKLSEAVRRAVEILRNPSDAQMTRIDEVMGLKPFAWDFVMVDEGQDWPPVRRDLLVEFYGAMRLVIADGIDQLVQTNEPIDWTDHVARGEYQRVGLWKSLRLKYNLSSFVKAVASRFGFHEWRLEPDSDIKVGRVIIVVGDREPAIERLRQFVREATEAGNSPVDLLFCVPPEYCDWANDERVSNIGPTIRRWGYRTWDGVNMYTRRETFPTSLDQVRIVQYESSRGLEGWAVFLLGLDLFYENKRNQYHADPDQQEGLFQDGHEAARQFAAQWIMIPLTRAIDTLVIHLASRSSELFNVLKDADRDSGGLAEWIEV